MLKIKKCQIFKYFDISSSKITRFNNKYWIRNNFVLIAIWKNSIYIFIAIENLFEREIYEYKD